MKWTKTSNGSTKIIKITARGLFKCFSSKNIQAQKDKAAAKAPVTGGGNGNQRVEIILLEQYSAIGRQHYTGPGMAFEVRPSGRNAHEVMDWWSS